MILRPHQALLVSAASLTVLALACGNGGGAGPGSTAASGASSPGGQGGASTSATSSGGDTGSGGGFDVHPGVLVDEGLVTRYYIDEDSMGQAPTELLDAAPDPLNLTLTYIPEMHFVEDADGNRGLRFDGVGLDGRASAPVDGSKLVPVLQTAKTATIETVLSIDAVTSNSSRISHIGFDIESGRLTLSTAHVTRLDFRLNGGSIVVSGPVDLVGAGRIVVHAVLDTAAADPAERARLYVNGGRLPAIAGTAPAQDQGIDLAAGRHYVLGNREIGGRTFQGTLYYSALYAAALSDAQVLQNALLLLSDDDTPAGSPTP